MEIKLLSGKWTKIFSCYKDAFLTGVYSQGKQTLEFEVYHPLTNNNPCIVSSTFLFNCIQANADNQTTMLQKIKDYTNYQACFNVITDTKNREIVEVYVRNDDITTCYLNVKRCPNLNLFKFYNSVIPVTSVSSPTLATDYNEVKSTTFNYSDGTNNYDVTIKKNGGTVWFKIVLNYVSGTGFSATIPNTNIPIEYRPIDNIYAQRVANVTGGVLTNTSITFNTSGTIVVSSNNTATHSVNSTFITTN